MILLVPSFPRMKSDDKPYSSFLFSCRGNESSHSNRCPIVYTVGKSDEILCGSGADRAEQLLSVMKHRPGFERDNLTYLRGLSNFQMLFLKVKSLVIRHFIAFL